MCDDVSNHQPHDCLPNGLFRRRSKKTSKLRVTGLCVGNSPVTGEFPAQRASNAENVSIWWRHDLFPSPAQQTVSHIASTTGSHGSLANGHTTTPSHVNSDGLSSLRSMGDFLSQDLRWSGIYHIMLYVILYVVYMCVCESVCVCVCDTWLSKTYLHGTELK